MCQDPAAILAILDGGEEEVDVRPNPAIESITVLAEMFRPWVGDHVLVGEPGRD
jgi:hypothetical protein